MSEKSRGVAAPVRGHGADGPDHRHVGDDVHAVGRFEQRRPQRPGDPVLERRGRQVGPEPHRAPGKLRWADVAQHHVGVGDRGPVAARPVARRAGHRARAAGADPERAAAVDPDDAAAARAHLGQVYDGHLDGVAPALHQPAGQGYARADLVLRRPAQPAVLDERRLGRRAAHVEADHVVQPHALADALGRHDARGRARLDDADGRFRRPVQ